MGRLRTVFPSNDDPHDPNHRGSKRKKTTPAAISLHTAQEIIGGKCGLYHCNYCNKDISAAVRIKCAVCLDFDLCIECFSVGAELNPHKSNHPYRVMDNLSFPLISPDWSADEELLLLEGIEMYGFGNWTEVSDNVGTKNRSQCIDHYNAIYMNSPYFPVPDLSHVKGKSREELLAMAKEYIEVKNETLTGSEISLKEEPSFKFEEPMKESPAHHMGSSNKSVLSAAPKKASNGSQIREEVKLEEAVSGRSIGEKKPRASGDEGPSVTELSGYNFKRQEFEIEYDNDAEQILADMEFKETDTDADRDLKLQVLRIYNKRLDERKSRKNFVIERNLLYPDLYEKSLSPDEREIYQRFKVFARFHSKEEHEQLLKSLIEEHRIAKRIQELQEARAGGCFTAADADRFIEEKRKKKAEDCAQKVKESSQAGLGGKVLLQPVHKDSSSEVIGQVTPSMLDDWDITGFVGYDLLSESVSDAFTFLVAQIFSPGENILAPLKEKELCVEIRILPAHYLKMLETLLTAVTEGNVSKKSDAHGHAEYVRLIWPCPATIYVPRLTLDAVADGFIASHT
ncbi:hypothetical protein ACFE04_002588 [Oxalis oulophora]